MRSLGFARGCLRSAVPAAGVIERLVADPGSGSEVARRAFVPALDVLESDQAILIRAELPGVERQDLEVGLEQGVLILRGEKGSRDDEERAGYRHVERRRGRFERRLRLPPVIDEAKIRASFRDGVLTLTLPKRPEERSELRTVAVTTG